MASHHDKTLISTTARGLALAMLGLGAATAGTVQRYLKLPEPLKIELPAQDWEGDQQPHTLSVIEWNRDSYKYWGWYGLNNGRGMGLVRSNDLIHWTKYEHNPLWLDARWPSVLKVSEAGHDVLYMAVTRDYDTPSSRIVLARSEDGLHLTEVKNLVDRVPKQRNQNPNLFLDPKSGHYYLTFYRGNDHNSFDIVSKTATDIPGLRDAAEHRLMHTTDTVAAPNLLFAEHAGRNGAGIYYLATEIFPGRYSKEIKKDWQVKVFAADKPDGQFVPVDGNPVQSGGRACLFQHVFDGIYYGYQSRLIHNTSNPKKDYWDMEVLEAPMPK